MSEISDQIHRSWISSISLALPTPPNLGAVYMRNKKLCNSLTTQLLNSLPAFWNSLVCRRKVKIRHWSLVLVVHTTHITTRVRICQQNQCAKEICTHCQLGKDALKLWRNVSMTRNYARWVNSNPAKKPQELGCDEFMLQTATIAMECL